MVVSAAAHRPHNVCFGLMLLAFGLLLTTGAASAFEITIYSQNGMHFSANSAERMQKKCDAFAGGFQQADVTLFQEVQGTNPDTVTERLEACVGAERKVLISKKFTKRGGNNEYYAIIYDRKLKLEKTVGFDDVADNAFARPPLAAKFSFKGKAFWVADFHAVFGASNPAGIKKRQDEAAAMRNIVYTTLNGLSPHTPIIIGGDWNLSASSPVFTAEIFAPPSDASDVCGHAGNDRHLIYPDKKTSLNPKGELSSPYDHFAFDRTHFRHCSVVRYHGDYALAQWRKDASDHVGIIGKFEFK